MGVPTESQPESTTWLARWSLRLPFILLVLAGMGALAFGGLMFLGWLLFSGWDDDTQVKTVTPAEVARCVATFLVADWDLPNPLRYGASSPAYPKRMKYYRDRITGIRGSSESGGWNGDGIDWYEFEMTPDLAVDLRARLVEVHSDQVTRHPSAPTGDQHAPPWWPTRWPADAICYYHTESHAQLILTPNGTRGWFRNFRW